MEAAALAMDVKIAERLYRRDFYENYRVLFQQSARIYRIEFWQACEKDYESIMVNGEVHVFSAATRAAAKQLRESRQQVREALEEWHSRKASVGGWTRWLPSPNYCVFRWVADALQAFDQSWVVYENSYVSELIRIEAHARKPVELAIALEQQLTGFESLARHLRRRHGRSHSDDEVPRETSPAPRKRPSLSSSDSLLSQCSEDADGLSRPRPPTPASPVSARKADKGELQQFAKVACSANSSTESHRTLRQLVEQVAVLNARANTQGKGRGDLTMDVLVAAADLLREGRGRPGSAASAAQHFLAAKVLDSFMNLRSYFSSIYNEIMEVDPQLSKNQRLVKALAAWEEAWELGERILLRPEMLQALCTSAGLCVEALRVLPELQEHVKDQDAELFMILPRLVILSDFHTGSRCEVLRFYLPHHFDGAERSDLQEVKEKFDQLRAEHPELPLSRTSMVRSAVLGFGHDTQGDSFLKRLERFSMELQRHKPSDWNQCCLVLLQCIESIML